MLAPYRTFDLGRSSDFHPPRNCVEEERTTKTKLKMNMKKIALLCAAAAAILFAPLQIHAATYTWSGTGFMGNQDFLWSNPFNWVGLAAPQTGETNVIIVLPNNGAPR